MSENLLKALAEFVDTPATPMLYWATVEGSAVLEINASTTLPDNAVEITQEQYNTIRLAYAVHKDGKIFEKPPSTHIKCQLKKVDKHSENVYTVYKDFPWLVCTTSAPQDYYTLNSE